jgi:hypothetical protein
MLEQATTTRLQQYVYACARLSHFIDGHEDKKHGANANVLKKI